MEVRQIFRVRVTSVVRSIVRQQVKFSTSAVESERRIRILSNVGNIWHNTVMTSGRVRTTKVRVKLTSRLKI